MHSSHANHSQIDQLLVKANQARHIWSQTDITTRSQLIRSWLNNIKKHAHECAHILTSEGGKPITQSRAEVAKCLDAMHWFCEQAEIFPWTQEPATNTRICHTPLGNILHIMPFNFPFWQLIRAAVPTLLAGNAVLIKPSSYAKKATQLCVQYADQLPSGLIQLCEFDSKDTPHIIARKDIHGVTFTGSNRVAKLIGAHCGEHLKTYIAEGAGQDPYLIMSDCLLKDTVSQIVASRLRHSGQACNAAKRLIVSADIYDTFIHELRSQLQSLHVGMPQDEHTDVGPLVSPEASQAIKNQIQQSLDDGATLFYQSACPADERFVPITVLTDVPLHAACAKQEIFGPVFTVIKATNTKEMIQIANDSDYGLCAGIFTQDKSLAMTVMPQLEAGQVVHNQCFSSSWALPFTGIKDSGIGSECSLLAFTNFTYPKLYKYA